MYVSPTVFSRDDALKNHVEDCIQINGKQAIKMPSKENNVSKFNNFHKQLPIPFVIYADLSHNRKILGCGKNKNYTQIKSM